MNINAYGDAADRIANTYSYNGTLQFKESTIETALDLINIEATGNSIELSYNISDLINNDTKKTFATP